MIEAIALCVIMCFGMAAPALVLGNNSGDDLPRVQFRAWLLLTLTPALPLLGAFGASKSTAAFLGGVAWLISGLWWWRWHVVFQWRLTVQASSFPMVVGDLHKSGALWGFLSALAYFVALFMLLEFGGAGLRVTQVVLGFYFLAGVSWVILSYKLALEHQGALTLAGKDQVFSSLYLMYVGQVSAVVVGLLMLRLQPGWPPVRGLLSAWPVVVAYLVGMSLMIGVTIGRRSVGSGVLVSSLGALLVSIWWVVEHHEAVSAVGVALAILATLAILDSMAWNVWWLHGQPLSGWISRLTLVCIGGCSALHLNRAIEWSRYVPSRSRGEALIYIASLVLGWTFYLLSSGLISREVREKSARPSEYWQTDNSGTFNLGHDSVPLVACIWLGAFIPLAWESSAHSQGFVDFLEIIQVIIIATTVGVVPFALRNGWRHSIVGLARPGVGRRLILQWTFLILILIVGWSRATQLALGSLVDIFK